MSEPFTRHVHDMFDAVKEARIPDQVQEILKNSVGKTRDSYDRMIFCSKESTRAFEQAMVVAQAGARTIGETILQNSEANADAMFRTALAMARAKTWSELAQLQGSFVARQCAVVGEQTKELAELWARIAQQTGASVNSAVAKSFEHVKNVG